MEKETRHEKLTRFASEFGTDKLEHDYLKYYAKNLPVNPKKILEVGVYKGASVKMFKSLFPKAKITGFDLFQEFDFREELKALDIECIQGNEHSLNDLYQIKDIFNVIVLDGSHHAGLEQLTFYHLFINNMTNGSLFIWEDLHTSMDKYYYGNELTEFEDTALYLLQSFEAKNPKTTKFIGEHELNILKQHIDTVQIFDSKIAFIWHK